MSAAEKTIWRPHDLEPGTVIANVNGVELKLRSTYSPKHVTAPYGFYVQAFTLDGATAHTTFKAKSWDHGYELAIPMLREAMRKTMTAMESIDG